MKKTKVSSAILIVSGLFIFLLGFFTRGFISSPTLQPTPIPQIIILTVTPTPELTDGMYLVSRVLDGDTIEIEGGIMMRYFGVDTPEKNQQWATEATRFNSELVLGKRVRVELGNSKFDRYGRTLAYVWVANREGKEEMVNVRMLEEGYSKLNIIKGDSKLKYLDILTTAEQWGRDHHNGLWLEGWVK